MSTCMDGKVPVGPTKEPWTLRLTVRFSPTLPMCIHGLVLWPQFPICEIKTSPSLPGSWEDETSH